MTPELKARGWVLRVEDIEDSNPIFVRGARPEDDPRDYKKGFVYAETEKEAEEYDRTHSYS